ncbi:MAG: hypothetical protein ACQKBY_09370 [Verrucomicrobiales bacterium]
MTLQEIRSEAAKLCDLEKGSLAADLLSMIAPHGHHVSDEEVMERVRQLESGEVAEMTFDQLKSGLGR